MNANISLLKLLNRLKKDGFTHVSITDWNCEAFKVLDEKAEKVESMLLSIFHQPENENKPYVIAGNKTYLVSWCTASNSFDRPFGVLKL